MSSSFSVALSGLQSDSEAINTTGNNLANMNTDGFKESQVLFKNLVSQSYGNSVQVGLGVGVPVGNQLFTQGAISTSQSPLAAAIQGNGFFVVSAANGQQLYTRDGNFTMGSDGVLRTQTGEAVQGWTSSSTGIDTRGAASDITAPTGQVLPPQATQNFSFNANLDASAVAGQASGSYSVPMQVVDSLGNTHDLSINFTKSSTAANTWTYQVAIPSGDLNTATATQNSATTNLLSTAGTITFNSDGSLVTTGLTNAVPLNITGLADSAADMNLNWSFLTSGAGDLTQYASASSVSSPSQDGIQGAELTSVAIEAGGQVVATYSNGQTKVAAQLALASIDNPNSLSNVGNNNFSVSNQTATPVIGIPNSGGRGQIEGGAIEGSNVDMAAEFTNLIEYQSGYQACSRVISTVNTLDQDLFNLIH